MKYQYNKLIILVSFLLLTILPGQECDSGFVWLEDVPVGCGGEHNCFYEADLNILQTLIDNSSETINLSLDDNEDGIMDPVELGYTEWVDGRLVVLDCFLSDIMPCNLSGALPENIGDLEFLEALWLSGNQLSGEIPESMGDLVNLELLYLSDNQFSGSIPESFCNLNVDLDGVNDWGVEYFNIWGNEICPPYPSCMDNEIIGEQDTIECMSGCTDPFACNYIEEAFEDDGSCLYTDECGICNGENNSCSSDNINFIGNWNDGHDETALADFLYDWGYILLPYNDVWGYTDEDGKEYALIGTWDGTHIIDMSTDTGYPEEISFIPGSFSTHRDIKTHGHYMYVGTEANLGDPALFPDWTLDPEGVQVIDISDPANPEIINEWDEIYQSHNLMVDGNGFLYIVGTDVSDDLIILDLSDPVNPYKVGGWSYYDAPSQDGYLHDVCIHEDVLYGCGIYVDRIYAFNISDKTNPQLIHEWSGIPSAHACWVSDDGNTLFTGSETVNGHIMSWDVSFIETGNVNLLDEWLPLNGENWSAHNLFVKGNYLYISYYVYGLQVLDISDPANLFNVGFYDTLEETEGMSIYSGVWGVFPFFSSNRIIMSDRVNGLYILEDVLSMNLGDLNDDGLLNILDIVIIANIILGTSDNVPQADVNQDGDLNILDIVILIDMILDL